MIEGAMAPGISVRATRTCETCAQQAPTHYKGGCAGCQGLIKELHERAERAEAATGAVRAALRQLHVRLGMAVSRHS